MANELKLERVYTKPIDTDGYRILVDRLWPRGVSKVNAQIDQWAKEITPTTELRKWFNHDPEKFDEFKHLYLSQLQSNPAYLDFKTMVHQKLETQNVIFVYAAKDEVYNHVVILAESILKGI
ncbi:DUF488 domain-containing protein [Paucilactobacillus nenjiangensis]|jgi:uncharacterized protein YeaO (DUF488 family)|uniref:DUF488 family protein n=1 Tax=Paucilactobacillus nenjiangensis TaxID=1296540 RepID=A0A5P1WY53_9LACO|nr:DUF488 family protein [Paucilactobacillus nenjiangensis]QER66582.1 DUF488 family protein [Paucilactobacillus nenjiangensis]